jgi:hypothetical protein
MDSAGKGDRPATRAITWEERERPERPVSELKSKSKLKLKLGRQMPGASGQERLVWELKMKLKLKQEQELPWASQPEWPLGLEPEWVPELSVRGR